MGILHRPTSGGGAQKYVSSYGLDITSGDKAKVAAHGRVRRARLRRFPYGVYYTIREGFIDVLAVCHGRRRPRRFDP